LRTLNAGSWNGACAAVTFFITLVAGDASLRPHCSYRLSDHIESNVIARLAADAHLSHVQFVLSSRRPGASFFKSRFANITSHMVNSGGL